MSEPQSAANRERMFAAPIPVKTTPPPPPSKPKPKKPPRIRVEGVEAPTWRTERLTPEELQVVEGLRLATREGYDPLANMSEVQ